MTRILVTGAGGFVAGAFLRRFADRPNLQLRGLSRRPCGQVAGVVHDLRQPLQLDWPADVVIHAAARASPWGSVAQYHADNVQATANVIDWCERNGRPRLLYLSSSSVFYNAGDQFDLDEDSPIGPRFINRYAASKYAGEQLLHGYAGAWLILRPRAVFGPGDTVLFPRILTAARRGKLPLIARADGTAAIGDLIFIDTLSDYLLRAAHSPLSRCAINLTNAEPVALTTLLLRVLDGLRLPRPTRTLRVGTAMAGAALLETLWRVLRLGGEPPITRFGVGVLAWSKTFNPSRMLAALGPPSTPIEQGIADFIAWQEARL